MTSTTRERTERNGTEAETKTSGEDTAFAYILVVLGITVFLPLAVCVNAIIDGFVISTLWGWFVVPIFGVGTLTMTAAFALVFIYRALNWRTPKKGEKSPGVLATLAWKIAAAAFDLGIGYVVHWAVVHHYLTLSRVV
jgi:hypothetical protein